MQSRGPKSFAIILAASALLALSACDSAEDRAEEHYQSAVELFDAGDVDRGLVELRNVFDLDPQHHEARELFADVLLENGDVQQAFGQYLLLSEFKPDHLKSRVRLAEIALAANNFDEARRHGTRALEIAPEDVDVQLVNAILEYQEAVQENDTAGQDGAVARLRQVKAEVEDPRQAVRFIVSDALRKNDFAAALREIDSVLVDYPEDEQFNAIRLRVLGALGDRDGIREQLERMVDLFPETPAYGADLIRWYVSEGNPEAAEAYIRERVAAADAEAADEERILLINFLRQTQGTDAALSEVDGFIEDGGSAIFRALRAGLNFDAGNTDIAIEEMEEVIADPNSDEQVGRFKVALAQMLQSIGNEVAARQRVEEVLAEDQTNVDAIKMLAGWLITEDKTDEAITQLRSALQDAPEDPQIMSLLARAHARNGNRELSREMLALAAQTSNGAREHAIPYANLLIAEENYSAAEDTLLISLRARPGQPDVLSLLGQVYVRQEDWARVEQVENTLRRLENEQATAAADGLRIARLRGQQRDEEAFQLLEDMAQGNEDVGAAEIAIVRTLLQDGDTDGAEEYVLGLVEEKGDSAAAKMLLAGIYRVTQRFDEAEDLYRSVLAEVPQSENTWRSLFGMKLASGDADGAREVLQEGLETIPEAPNLQWALAGFLEQEGKIDEAIEIYEALYTSLPNSPIVANNLASLIATYREDDAELERAFVIARRLRGAEIPAFMDTYGWIAYRRGQYEEALEYLEPAAAALTSDPVVQYHYGMALAANGRTEDAIAQLQAAIDLAGPADTRPQFDRARAEIENLQQSQAEGSGN